NQHAPHGTGFFSFQIRKGWVRKFYFRMITRLHALSLELLKAGVKSMNQGFVGIHNYFVQNLAVTLSLSKGDLVLPCHASTLLSMTNQNFPVSLSLSKTDQPPTSCFDYAQHDITSLSP